MAGGAAAAATTAQAGVVLEQMVQGEGEGRGEGGGGGNPNLALIPYWNEQGNISCTG